MLASPTPMASAAREPATVFLREARIVPLHCRAEPQRPRQFDGRGYGMMKREDERVVGAAQAAREAAIWPPTGVGVVCTRRSARSPWTFLPMTTLFSRTT